MKNIILAMVLLFSVSMYGVEKREYERINGETMVVRVYQDGYLQQVGTMKYHHNTWQICGIWKQLDRSGQVNMRVEYECGRRLWVEKDLGHKLIRIQSKGSF